MGRKNVPVKTKEGTQEIRARSLGLAPRIRTALLLVDGVKSSTELERLMEAAGVTPGALQLLLDKGLIRFPEEEQNQTITAVTVHDAAHTILVPEAANADSVPEAIPYSAPTILNVATVIDARQQTAPSPQSPNLHIVAEVSAEQTSVPSVHVDMLSGGNLYPAPPPQQAPPPSERVLSAPLEVVTLLELETILGGATKMEVATILGIATLLELTPTQMMAPKTAVKVPLTEPARLPPLAQAQREHELATVPQPKVVVPATVLRMNLMMARAHLAAALDQFLEVEAYVLRQNVVACESREELEQMYALIEGALLTKIDRSAATRLLLVATAMLDR